MNESEQKRVFSATQWKEDINILMENFVDFHPLLENIQLKEVFINNFEILKNKISFLSDTEIYFSIKEYISVLNDFHSDIYPNADINIYKEIYPIYFKDFGDDYHVLFTIPKFERFTGSRLVKVNGYAIRNIEDRLSSLIPKETRQSLKIFTSDNLNNHEILSYKKIVQDKKIAYTLEKNNEIFNIELFPDDKNKIKFNAKNPIKYPVSYANNRNIYFWRFIECKKTIYFKMNRMDNYELLRENLVEIFTFIQNNHIEKFIVDIRHNTGGMRIWEILPLNIALNKTINRKKHFFIVTGKRTASSALVYLYSSKEKNNVITIGEIPQQKPNFYYGRSYDLPNTKLKYKCSEFFTQLESEDKEHFMPDIQICEMAEDFFNGKDTILDYIFKNY